MNRRDRWVAPKEDGAVLIDPPGDRVEELLQTNRQRLSQARTKILGQSLAECRSESRSVIAHLAIGPKAQFEKPIIATGHQPDFYHPGVWIKNFAINGLARRAGAHSLNVNIDTDTRKSASIAFPIVSTEPRGVRVQSIPYDSSEHEAVFFTARIQDRARFQKFPIAAGPLWEEWPFRPFLPTFWDTLLGVLTRNEDHHGQAGRESVPLFSAAVANARRAFEARWDGGNLESDARLMAPELRFVPHVLLDLPRFHAVYNECVREYRRRHHLRSRSHPVPELAAESDWLEAPLWWVDNSGHRHRVFVRQTSSRIELRSGPKHVEAGTRLTELQPLLREYCLRALMTTMYLRLFVADLFIHGIGGAKYDEVTDDIIHRYFGIEPPEYMVVTGTLRLPFPRFPATQATRQQLWRQLRDLRWHPEQYLDVPNPLAEQKRRWLAREPQTAGERKTRYRELLNLTEMMRPAVANEIAAVEAQLARCDEELAANEILSRRDYSFVLYPEEKLRRFLTQVL